MNEYMKMLGFKAKDKVTGFSGVISSICFDLYGCVQFLLTPETGKDGKLTENYWFDAKRVTILGKNPVMAAPNFGQIAARQEKGPAAKPAFTSLPVR